MIKNPTFSTLFSIAKNNSKRLFGVFSLVTLENILFLLYPLLGGFAINAILAHNTKMALVYAVFVLFVWMIGSARRAVDTRVFVRIYAELAVPAILNQKTKWNTSSATAHATLARQFIEFFEEHLPTLITSVFSVIGAVFMLLTLEFYSGLITLTILIIFAIILPKYSKKNDELYFSLNNQLENEVSVIESGKNHDLKTHYNELSRLRIAISNREATSYLVIGFVLAILFGATLAILSTKTVEAGHIYAVVTYLWNFAMSIDDAPRLVEKFSELKDIGERVDVEEK